MFPRNIGELADFIAWDFSRTSFYETRTLKGFGVSESPLFTILKKVGILPKIKNKNTLIKDVVILRNKTFFK
jgi:hypothetical protein